MDTIRPGSAARRRAAQILCRLAGGVAVVWVSAGAASAHPDSKILFPRDTSVPRAVQQFAWWVIETRCNYQAYEREQRSFWAFAAAARRVDGDLVYSIDVLSELTWRKAEPPAVIEMTVVDDGGIRLAALRSTFVVCGLDAR